MRVAFYAWTHHRRWWAEARPDLARIASPTSSPTSDLVVRVHGFPVVRRACRLLGEARDQTRQLGPRVGQKLAGAL